MYNSLHKEVVFSHTFVRVVFLFVFILLLLPGFECMGQIVQTKELFRNKEAAITLEIISKQRGERILKDTTVILAGPNARTKTTTLIKAFEGKPGQMHALISNMKQFVDTHKKGQNIQQRYDHYNLIIKDKKKYLLVQNMWGDAIGFKFSTIYKIEKAVSHSF